MMQSARFGLPVVLTEHASRRMRERAMNEALVLDIVDTGVKTVMHHGGPQP